MARDKIKVLINGAEMHMSMNAWRTKYGLPPRMSREEGRVQYVPEGSTIPHLFDTLEYMTAQPERTAWLSRRTVSYTHLTLPTILLV